MNAKELVSQMTLEEKASLCSGLDFWRMKGVERLGLPSIMITDGPHGLRKQAGASDHLGITDSIPATCFPTASATANSFNRALLKEIGGAIAEECLQEGVAVLLGPGANIKRSPLCGRNFEYFSEDPLVSSELTASFVDGVQEKGIGTSPKHFAANNQEKYRMTNNSIVDDRALREIYLAAFEGAVKKSKPWTMMCSYNLLNGTFVNGNHFLLTEILRDEWGFDGLVVSDWGAVTERISALAAGLDLEMPASAGVTDADIVKAVQSGELDEKILDKGAERIVNLILKAQANKKEGYKYDAEAHHRLAKKAAAESAVLLKNEEGLLPLKRDAKVAVLGAFAKTPRYQGAGSSRIHPTKIDSAFEALVGLGLDAEYAPGYPLKKEDGDGEKLLQEAVELAAKKDIVLVFAGLPDEYESEGFDRDSLDMPESHNRLIEEVSKVNKNVAVILQTGSPITMPWADSVKAILLAYLSGQAGGSAQAELLLGEVSPSGKLAESYPLAIEDTPCYSYYKKDADNSEYRESIFVGYRYYDTAGKKVAYPFGHGLSYTGFEYSDLMLSKAEWTPGEPLTVSVQVKNIGQMAGAEAVQLYVSLENSKIFRAAKELKGFEKVQLAPGESKTVSFELGIRSFAYYNAAVQDWAVESGEYKISIGASSADIRLVQTLRVIGDGRETLLGNLRETAPTYFNLPQGAFVVSDAEFGTVYGKALPLKKHSQGEAFTTSSRLDEVQETFIGRKLLQTILGELDKVVGKNDIMQLLLHSIVMESPLRTLAMLSQGKLSRAQIANIVAAINMEAQAKGFFAKKLAILKAAKLLKNTGE